MHREADLGLRHHSRLADASFDICILRHGFGSGLRQGEETPFLQLTAIFSWSFFSELGTCEAVHAWPGAMMRNDGDRRVEDSGIHFPESNNADRQAHVIPAEPQCRAADQPPASRAGTRRPAYELRVLSFRGPPAQGSVAKRGGGRKGCG